MTDYYEAFNAKARILFDVKQRDTTLALTARIRALEELVRLAAGTVEESSLTRADHEWWLLRGSYREVTDDQSALLRELLDR